MSLLIAAVVIFYFVGVTNMLVEVWQKISIMNALVATGATVTASIPVVYNIISLTT